MVLQLETTVPRLSRKEGKVLNSTPNIGAWQENVFRNSFQILERNQSLVSYSVTLTPSLKYCMKYIEGQKQAIAGILQCCVKNSAPSGWPQLIM